MNDLLSNFISNIKNALINKKLSVIIPFSNFILQIVKLLYKEGFLISYKIVNINKNIYILCSLKKSNGLFSIHQIKRISKPSQRIYYSVNELNKINLLSNGDSIYIISTPYGVYTEKVCLEKKLSGEILCKIN